MYNRCNLTQLSYAFKLVASINSSAHDTKGIYYDKITLTQNQFNLFKTRDKRKVVTKVFNTFLHSNNSLSVLIIEFETYENVLINVETNVDILFYDKKCLQDWRLSKVLTFFEF